MVALYEKARMRMRLGAISLIAIIIVSYTAYEARYLLEGPSLSVKTPENGEALLSPLFTVSGNSENVASLVMNGRQIFVDESGNFSEKIIASKGYNVVKIEAKDKFGRQTEKSISLVYKTN